MKLPWYILKKPSIGNFVPLLGKNIANSIGPFIFLPKHIALLLHKETHRKRQKQIGLFVFGFKYLFDPKFRFREELIAVKEGMKYLKKNNIPFNFDKNAKFLSSYIYLWPVSKGLCGE